MGAGEASVETCPCNEKKGDINDVLGYCLLIIVDN